MSLFKNVESTKCSMVECFTLPVKEIVKTYVALAKVVASISANVFYGLMAKVDPNNAAFYKGKAESFKNQAKLHGDQFDQQVNTTLKTIQLATQGRKLCTVAKGFNTAANFAENVDNHTSFYLNQFGQGVTNLSNRFKKTVLGKQA